MSRRKRSTAPPAVAPSTGTPAIALPKPKRYVNRENLELIASLPCGVCDRPAPSDPDHVISRGAGGGDELNNLQSLCRTHHVERHKIGIKTFMERYNIKISLSREKHDLPSLNLALVLN